MSQTDQLTQKDKQRLKNEAEQHISQIGQRLQQDIDRFEARIQEQYALVPRMREMNVEAVSPDSEALDLAVAKVLMYRQMQEEARRVQGSPYFVRLDVQWQESGEYESIYISKFEQKELGIYSWVAPISTLRYAELGTAAYEKPDKSEKFADISRRDNLIITSAEIVFMTHEDTQHPRQVVFQKHFAERRSFLLPEIVAELDRLQDQIIRSDPQGPFLISGPAGSGKTTLALHRIAYLVLTPEFKDFFAPERIMVFVADEGAIKYFSNLLPELGINGVKISTFNDWALMIANSRFRASKLPNRFKFQDTAKTVDYIVEHNPIPELAPRQILDEYRKLKQQVIAPIKIKEGNDKEVYSKLHELYTAALDGLDTKLTTGFRKYLKFQKDNRYLDEVDLVILLSSLEHPTKPYAHVVVDEVQNWLPEQLRIVRDLADRRYESVSYIGDIRQKTKAFTIQAWSEINEDFDNQNPRKVELLKVYRNTKQILEYLQQQGYAVEVDDNARNGLAVQQYPDLQPQAVTEKAKEIALSKQNVQVGILAKYQEDLNGLEYLAYEHPNIHVLTIEEAQGLEFHTVIVLKQKELKKNAEHFVPLVGHLSGNEYADQNKHLFYVAVTRAQEELHIFE